MSATRELSAKDAERAYLTILAAPIPPTVNPKIRREPRKFWAAKVRELFKSLGIKGISVTAPNYSMASSIDISLPYTRDVTAHEKYENGFLHHEAIECKFCQTKSEARHRVERIVLAAFPDLDDRGDMQSDYSDFCFIVN